MDNQYKKLVTNVLYFILKNSNSHYHNENYYFFEKNEEKRLQTKEKCVLLRNCNGNYRNDNYYFL